MKVHRERLLPWGAQDFQRQDSEHLGHVSHGKAGHPAFPDKLYVVTCIFNPLRWRSRVELYRAFEKHMHESGVELYTIEAAFGDRPFEVTEANDPHDIQVRTKEDAAWMKERLLCLAIQRLPEKAQYIAWVDADVTFARPNWAQETLHALQHFAVVSPMSNIVDTGPEYELLPANDKDPSLNGQYETFFHSYVNDRPMVKQTNYGHTVNRPLHHWHPGMAAAWRRDALDAVGGLLDFSIAGNGDHLMCCALIGQVETAIPNGMHPEFREMVLEWQSRCEKYIKRNVSSVPGIALHGWHSAKRNRGYTSRWHLLIEEQFQPSKDLKLDTNGLWQLTDHNPDLKRRLRAYMKSRNEDSIEI